MTRTNPSRLPSVLQRLVGGYRRRWRLISVQRGVLLTLAVLVACVGLAVTADRLLRLAPVLRMVVLGVIGASFLACAARWVVWPGVVRFSDRRAAIELGRRFTETQEDLVTAVELSENEETQQGISRALIVSVLDRIARRAAGVDYRAALPVKPVLAVAAAFLAVAAAFHMAYLARPEAVRNALSRLFQPNRSVPFFTYTKLAVQPGNHVVCTGDTVEVVAGLTGRQAPTAYLQAHLGSEALRLAIPCTEGRAQWQSGPLFQDLTYRVSAGDAISDWYRVRVVPPPAVRNRYAVLHDPPYAGSRARVVESIQGPLEMIEGSDLVLGVEPVVRGSDPRFQCKGELVFGEVRLGLKPEAAGRLRSPRFTPQKTGEWIIELKDRFGFVNRAAESVFIKVLPDRVPRVTVREPQGDLAVLVGERIGVLAEAEDEFGLRNLKLRYRKAGEVTSGTTPQRWQERTLRQGGVDVRRLSAETELDTEELALAPGDTLEYKATAADYAADALVRRGESRVYRLTVLSATEHLERTMGALRNLQLELARRAVEQRAEAAKVGQLAESADTKPVSEEARRAELRERELARATEALAGKLESLIPELARNPSSPTSLLSGLERLGRAVRAVAGDPMASAANSLGQAADAQPGEQTPALKTARQSEEDAARRLEDLTRMAEALQRRSILEKLAADAEWLAAQQRELKAAAILIGMKAIGARREDLDAETGRALDTLAAAERAIENGVESLTRDLERAAQSLAFSKPADAAAAASGGEKLESDGVADKADRLARDMERNVLLSPLPVHDEVAASLTEVAQILRGRAGSDSMEAVAKELEEFLRRQKQINAQIETAISSTEKPQPAVREPRPATGPELGADQARLGNDVSEHASALRWLAQEIRAFQSDTASRLGQASGEMRAGVHDLYASAMPEGLEHGRRALALLEAAREKFEAERGQMAGGMEPKQLLEAALLLQRILIGQKKVNNKTAAADEVRAEDAEAFIERALALARKQSALRADARRLERMLAQGAGAQTLVAMAGEKMDISRLALAAGDTGKDTRVVQREIVALLEKLLGDQKNSMSGMGLAGMRALALMQMMGQIGMRPGGFAGGTNAPILPGTLREAENSQWRRTRSRFEEYLGEGAEEQYPVQFRDLLNAYFERLRKEPAR